MGFTKPMGVAGFLTTDPSDPTDPETAAGITDLPAASAYAGTEVFPLVQSGVTKKGLISALATYLAGIAAWLPFSKLTGAIALSQMGVKATGYVQAIAFAAEAVDFNDDNSDTVIPITLPAGCTRFLVAGLRISGADGTCTTATFGLFTGAGGTGTAIVAGGSACTVSTELEGTNNNAQAATIVNSATQSYKLTDVPNLYFRIGTAQGVARTANVAVAIVALP